MVGEDEAGDGQGEGTAAEEIAEEEVEVAAVGEDFCDDTPEYGGPGFGDFGAEVVGFEKMETGVGDEITVFGHGGDASESIVAADGFEKVTTLP